MATGNATDRLKDRLKQAAPELAAALEKDYRDDLNANPHILDISYESLRLNTYGRAIASPSQTAAYNTIYSKLIAVVSKVCAAKTVSSISSPEFAALYNSTKSVGVIFVNGGDSNRFLVGSSYAAIRNFVTLYISRDPSLKASRFGEVTEFKPKKDAKGRVLADEYTSTTRSKIDIGHTPSENNENLSSPLEKNFRGTKNCYYFRKCKSRRIS